MWRIAQEFQYLIDLIVKNGNDENGIVKGYLEEKMKVLDSCSDGGMNTHFR